jgi:putative ATP-dependent endonuclease of OLD family
MHIEKVIIDNYKCFKTKFELNLNENVNIIVGNNEAGKSTIIEAINICLTGLLNGRILKNNLTQYLFNRENEISFIDSLKTETPLPPPEIKIEVYFCNGPAELEGNNNSLKSNASGISYKIVFDEEYRSLYNTLITGSESVESIPIEYYKISWQSFSRNNLISNSIPFKSSIIDSTATRFQNGSDIYISRIIRNELNDLQKVEISQAYRKLKEQFKEEDAIKTINENITEMSSVSEKDVKIGVNFSTKDAWENGLTTFVDDIPFQAIGKGEQCIIKTNLSLGSKQSVNAGVLLIEEPENHLSHTKLNKFVKGISNKSEGKQIIITTHNSFVSNKLSLENLTLLNNFKTFKLSDLDESTYTFFKKLPGYPTLRMILAKKTILVEGDSDELIVQRAYMDQNDDKLPIENEIDIVSVKLTFKRFLNIAKPLNLAIAVVTDNDHDYENKITKKYQDYVGSESIKIFADDRNDLHTLEPQFAKANEDQLKKLCDVIGLDYSAYNTVYLVSEKMKKMKTKWALKVFESEESLNYPKYILDTITWANEQ